MTALALLRAQAEALCSRAGLPRPSFKRADQPEFLLVTYGQAPADVLTGAGFQCFPLSGGRWGLEPPPSFYINAPQVGFIPWMPGEAYQLYRLLRLHPLDASVCVGRLCVKAAEAGKLEPVCRRLLGVCALRLRRGEPLPGGVLPWLAYELKRRLVSC